MDPSVFDNANPEGREGDTDQEVTVPDTVGVWTLMAVSRTRLNVLGE
jgi:hypothetical protein